MHFFRKHKCHFWIVAFASSALDVFDMIIAPSAAEDTKDSRFFGQVMGFVTRLSAFSLTTFYKCVIISKLLVSVNFDNIDTLEDFANSDLKVYVPKDSGNHKMSSKWSRVLTEMSGNGWLQSRVVTRAIQSKISRKGSS